MRKHSPFNCLRVLGGRFGSHAEHCLADAHRTKARKLKAQRASNRSRQRNRP